MQITNLMNNQNDSANFVFSDNGHTLCLFSQETDKYAIHNQFLSSRKNKVLYISGEDSGKIKGALENKNIHVVNPDNFNTLNESFKHIVVDASSITPKPAVHKKIGVLNLSHYNDREKILAEGKSNAILCTYNIKKINQDEIKFLLGCHDKAIIIKEGNTSPVVENSDISEKSVERFVKNDLEVIVLSLLMQKPMCGVDIKKAIYKSFNVLLSSGTLYPLLHKLQKSGLLECKTGFGKIKVYTSAQEEVYKVLSEHIKANSFFDSFIGSALRENDR